MLESNHNPLKKSFRIRARGVLASVDKSRATLSDKMLCRLIKREILQNLYRIPRDSHAILQKLCKIPRDSRNSHKIPPKIPQNPPRFHTQDSTPKIPRIPRRTPRNILVYLPLDMEVDIFPLIKDLRKMRNLRIFTPFVENNHFKIVPFRLPLSKNKYNIPENNNSTFMHFNKIDIAIVPILGMDSGFGRVGFGKGMYDRFCAQLKKKPFVIFTSRILCVANADICEDFDIRGDIAISQQRGMYDFTDNSWTCSQRTLRRPSVFYRTKALRAKSHH